uniref:HIG1 domain-containing protein n=1 Tax=Buteo japonicus TaxID=224669 RepID=A0A8C0HLG6_9AVES
MRAAWRQAPASRAALTLPTVKRPPKHPPRRVAGPPGAPAPTRPTHGPAREGGVSWSSKRLPCPAPLSRPSVLLFSAGCLCTVGILTYGLISFKRGNTRQSQLMMRARILAQGFTFAALLGGMVVTAMKSRK